MANVISLAERTDSAAFATIEQTLESALQDVRDERGAFAKGRKCLVIALDDNDGQYRINFVNGGMKMSECVALCEAMKIVALTEMNYITTNT